METPRQSLAELRTVFERIAGSDKKIDQSEFKKALELKDDYFVNRLFAMFDQDKSGTIEINEFLGKVEEIVLGDADKKLQFAYQLHDDNDDGLLQKAEIDRLIVASLNENNLQFPPEQVKELVDLLFAEADLDKSGEISCAEFANLVKKFPDLLDAMTVSPVSWLKPRQRTQEELSPEEIAAQKKAQFQHYIENNWLKLAFLALYIGINLFLFVGAANKYASLGANIYVQIARGGGATINFNGALILIPVMRHLLTWVRKSPINEYIPIDESIEFHKIVGQTMFGFAIVHTIAHFLNYSTLQVPFFQSLLGTKAGLSGFLLLVVFLAMWITAQDFIRKSGKFAIFYIVHSAYVLWLILALIHGPVFWKWSLIPLIGFAVEQIFRWQITKEPTNVVNAVILPSKVLNLQIARPASFDYQPGDYLFVKCPAISKFEWHPFTISSPPEVKDLVSVHIRSVGSWTGKIYNLFREHHEQWAKSQNPNPDPGIQVYIDGPYGTPSTHIFESKYVMLVAAGIGVTPFASILRSILLRSQAGDTTMRLQKVHFYWINREQKAFEWFVELLSKIELADIKHIFDINLYLTGAQQRSDMKSSTLFVAMDLKHSQTQVDLITGLKSRTKTGRPDWDAIFAEVAQQHAPDKVDVFFCGPAGLSHQLKKLCAKYGFAYRKENF